MAEVQTQALVKPFALALQASTLRLDDLSITEWTEAHPHLAMLTLSPKEVDALIKVAEEDFSESRVEAELDNWKKIYTSFPIAEHGKYSVVLRLDGWVDWIEKRFDLSSFLLVDRAEGSGSWVKGPRLKGNIGIGEGDHKGPLKIPLPFIDDFEIWVNLNTDGALAALTKVTFFGRVTFRRTPIAYP